MHHSRKPGTVLANKQRPNKAMYAMSTTAQSTSPVFMAHTPFRYEAGQAPDTHCEIFYWTSCLSTTSVGIFCLRPLWP